MKLTKRETILITILLALLVGFGSYFLLFEPLRSRLEDRQRQAEQLEVKKSNMELTLAMPDMAGAYDEQLAEAEENYDSFYSTLNSYTIDNIISDLLDDQTLSITSLKISAYLPVSEAEMAKALGTEREQSQEETEAPQNKLLKCTVDLTAGGSFNDVMAFVDALNQKSFCVSVRAMQIRYGAPNNSITQETEFTSTIEIYGVDMPAGMVLT